MALADRLEAMWQTPHIQALLSHVPADKLDRETLRTALRSLETLYSEAEMDRLCMYARLQGVRAAANQEWDSFLLRWMQPTTTTNKPGGSPVSPFRSRGEWLMSRNHSHDNPMFHGAPVGPAVSSGPRRRATVAGTWSTGRHHSGNLRRRRGFRVYTHPVSCAGEACTLLLKTGPPHREICIP